MFRSIAEIIGHGAEEKRQSEYTDPRWIALSSRTIAAHPFCNSCKQRGKRLHAHHSNYRPGAHLWDVSPDALVVLCDGCHELITAAIRQMRDTMSRGNAQNMAKLSLLLKESIHIRGESDTIERFAR